MSTSFANSPVSTSARVAAPERRADTQASSNQFWFSAVGLAAGFIVLVALSIIG